MPRRVYCCLLERPDGWLVDMTVEEFFEHYPIGDEPTDDAAARLQTLRKLGHRGPFRLRLWMSPGNWTWRVLWTFSAPTTTSALEADLTPGEYAITAHEGRYVLRTRQMGFEIIDE